MKEEGFYMDTIVIKKIFIWDALSHRFRLTKFRLDEISASTVVINGIKYNRKGSKRIGRIIETKISTNNERIVGRVIPFFA